MWEDKGWGVDALVEGGFVTVEFFIMGSSITYDRSISVGPPIPCLVTVYPVSKSMC